MGICHEVGAARSFHHSPFSLRHSLRLRHAEADHRVQRRIQQFLNEGIRRVVGAAGLAGVALGQSLRRQSNESEPPGRDIDGGNEFEQAFVHRAQFLWPHIAVVDGGQTSALTRPTKRVHGVEESPVFQQGLIEVGALLFGKESAKRREGEFGFTGGETSKDDAAGGPLVPVAVEAGATERTVPKPAKRVSYSVDIATFPSFR